MSRIPAILARARARLVDLHHTSALTLARDGFTHTSVCHVAARSGRTAHEDAAAIERGECRLALPAQSTLILHAGELVTIDGRRYRVVWAPPRGSLNVSDQYGVTEVR